MLPAYGAASQSDGKICNICFWNLGEWRSNQHGNSVSRKVLLTKRHGISGLGPESRKQM